MSYPVAKLVTNSWYLSGIVARNLQRVTGDQLNDGVDLLNALLAIKTANQRMIPYYSVYDFTAVVGQEAYPIPNLILCETFTFFIGPVRYSMTEMQRKAYFGLPRVNGMQSLPNDWHIERSLGGATLYIYFVPNTTYPLEITGKFSLNSVTVNQDLSLTLDPFYIEYLRYALAEYMCHEYNITFQPQAAQQLASYEEIIQDISPLDLSMTKQSTLSQVSYYNYGDITLGRGWRP